MVDVMWHITWKLISQCPSLSDIEPDGTAE